MVPWRSKLSGLTVAHPQRSLGDCRAIVHSLLPPPQLLEARQPGRGTCPRSACQVCTHYGTSPTLPMWQPLAPQRAGPSVMITPVPMSGRAHHQASPPTRCQLPRLRSPLGVVPSCVHKAWSQRLASWPQWGSKWVDFRSPVRKPCWATAEPKSTHFWTHLSSLKPVDRAAGPVRALARGARQVHPLHHTSPTLPAWQPPAPQRAGPSAGITPVPRSGRARDARPPSPPWSQP